MGAASGVSSSMTDLLQYYKSLMDAFRAKAGVGSNLSASTVLRKTDEILSGHVVFNPPVFGLLSENTYGYGWIKTKLPATLGLLSDNPGVVSSMPVIARGARPQTIFYHQGCLSGQTTCVILMPESETCVITLTNTRSIGDSADWISQLLVEHITATPEKNDFLGLAHEGVRGQTSRYPQAREALDKDRQPNSSSSPLEDYVGRYFWSSDCYHFDVLKDGDALKLQIGSREDQIYELSHHQSDEFTWLMSDEEEQRRGRFIQSPEAYRLRFKRGENKEIVSLTWCEMGGGPGEFIKSV
jgi:hypothetical protein